MKEAILIIGALLLWFFSSQSFWYSLTQSDYSLLTRIQARIDLLHSTRPSEISRIHDRLSHHLLNLSPQERAYVVLEHVSFSLQSKRSAVAYTTYHSSVIDARASLFQ
jgi:hypothetical protein